MFPMSPIGKKSTHPLTFTTTTTTIQTFYKHHVRQLIHSHSQLLLLPQPTKLSINIMSDNARQGFTDKAAAAVKPDSEKSTTEHLGDKFKGTADSAASSVQPESEKSTTQKVGDTFSSNSNENSDSLLDKTKNTLGLNK